MIREGVFLRPSVLLLASLALRVSLSAADIPADYSTKQNLDDIINKYQVAQVTQREALRGTRIEEDISAKLPKLEKQGKLKVLRMISKIGINKFEQIGQFIGDNTVFKEVIVRYLQTEEKGRENGSIAISPANYNFKIAAIVTENSQTTYIFDVTPKRKADGLFKGQLWLDGNTGMPLKEKGQLVKTPSVFLKSIKFERDYEIHDGLAVPKHIESVAEVRMFGTAELSANFSDPTRQDGDDEPTATDAP
jgi:hypothetical protein